MAIGVQLDFRGATLEQYDEVLETTGFLPGGPSTATALFHWVTKTEDGIRIIDVWESRQAFERFASEANAGIFLEVGAPEPPLIQFFEVHNYLSGSRRRG
jgi:hypothetical protein